MAEAEKDLQLSEQEGERLGALWAQAAEPVAPRPEQTTAQALAAGVNFRIHLGHAFRAAWETSVAVVKGAAAAHVPFAFWAWAEVAAEAVGAAHAIFSSLVQRMRPIDYVTAVILSAHPDGLTEDELRQAVEQFLKDPKAFQFAWHFGMNESRVQRAREVLDAPNWFAVVLNQLDEANFLIRDKGKLKFKSRDFNVGWRSEG